MSVDFHKFAKLVNDNLLEMEKHGRLFQVEADRDDIVEAYLGFFPDGTNPIYIKNTEHDCSCCKQFIRNAGRVVAIRNGEMQTVWEGGHTLPHPYNVVAKEMDTYIRQRTISGLFQTKEAAYGVRTTRQLVDGNGTLTWNHFWYNVPQQYRSAQPDTVRGETLAAHDVLKRGMNELTMSALDEVFGLIGDNAIYRGEEFRNAVMQFRLAKQKYDKLSAARKELFCWENSGQQFARFRNTAIGTLVVDLSSGVETDIAVRAFETKVAPTNYKRPTALITPAMIEKALTKLESLGLRSAVDRRMANARDISVRNVLWVDNTERSVMRDPLKDALLSGVRSNRKPAKNLGEDISIDEFINDVLPSAETVQLLNLRQFPSNFVTVTAPVDPRAGRLFKWDNGFAWSYAGNVTDSIKEKVKAAGGNVDAKLRFSLEWHNLDDLDIHVDDPAGRHIYFGSRYDILDVDMNAGVGRTRTPVENMAFKAPINGVYNVEVNQYNMRETDNVGFNIQVACGAETMLLRYPKAVRGTIQVGRFHYENGKLTRCDIDKAMEVAGSSAGFTKWGIDTAQPARVRMIMHSPNHWDGEAGVGNRHTFFILEGCSADEPQRGIYNEFLSNELNEHRKVFEVLGNKTKCPVVEDQLSGMGFSSTRGDVVAVSVRTGSATRNFNVHF